MNRAILHENGYLQYKCPACGSHAIPVQATDKNWQWNGDLEKPTISPSVKHFYPGSSYDEHPNLPKFICHYLIRDGNIEFCGDCTHDKSGQTFPLPDYPSL